MRMGLSVTCKQSSSIADRTARGKTCLRIVCFDSLLRGSDDAAQQGPHTSPGHCGDLDVYVILKSPLDRTQKAPGTQHRVPIGLQHLPPFRQYRQTLQQQYAVLDLLNKRPVGGKKNALNMFSYSRDNTPSTTRHPAATASHHLGWYDCT